MTWVLFLTKLRVALFTISRLNFIDVRRIIVFIRRTKAEGSPSGQW